MKFNQSQKQNQRIERISTSHLVSFSFSGKGKLQHCIIELKRTYVRLSVICYNTFMRWNTVLGEPS
ncbi:hypothetical protein PAECIP111802_07476 [Paenibacillus allorhizosphaerae]|uniref:Uncharacterized protein n=1 Tax=Paenibacillus allorhizosphaerae TaxID=2849866 RepID=A0ABM8VV40_9BACL|nr:hypothetical protein PAECIP111802_07476 [Paenibacillus allorhizosphaerae]